MTKAHKVRTTKVRQSGTAASATKAGKPYRGANSVAQKDESSKKNARKAAATKRAG